MTGKERLLAMKGIRTKRKIIFFIKKVSIMNQGLLFDLDIVQKNESSSFYEAMNFFMNTAKTEEAFYLRFQVMPVEFKNSIKSYYQLNEEWQIFKKICKFWKV